MKTKCLYLASVSLLAAGLVACGGSDQKTGAATNDSTKVANADNADTAKVASAVEQVEIVEESTAPADMAMLENFYKECVFGFDGHAEEFCTPECLKKLAEANEYDDGGYATWEFRTMSQDGDGPSEVTGIEPADDGWYIVSYLDMGAKGVTKVLVKDGKIADYKRMMQDKAD